MHFTTILTGLLAASPIAARAIAERQEASAAAGAQWTIVNFNRPCNAADTSCTYYISVDRHTGAGLEAGAITVTAASQASRAQVPPTPLGVGNLVVSAGWSGQFGEGNGFTTLAVVDEKQRLIVYPAYTDKEMAGGAVVKPDRSYPVINLP